MAKKRGSDHPVQPDGSLPAADLPSQSSKEVTVQYLPKAPKSPKGKQIRPRRIIPTVPEGTDVPDQNPSPPVDIKPPQRSS